MKPDDKSRPTPWRRGLHARIAVTGERGLEVVDRAAISTGTSRTVIVPDLAAKLGDALGPRACVTTSRSERKLCGPTVHIALAMPECKPARVDAIVAKLPKGPDLVVGRDVLGQVEATIDYRRDVPISCRRRDAAAGFGSGARPAESKAATSTVDAAVDTAAKLVS